MNRYGEPLERKDCSHHPVQMAIRIARFASLAAVEFCWDFDGNTVLCPYAIHTSSH